MLKYLTEKQIAAVISAAEALNAVSPSSELGLEYPGDIEKSVEDWERMKPYRVALLDTISGLSLEARFELMAVMWLGRGDADGPFDQLLRHAKRLTDEGHVEYIAEKSSSLPLYLRQGLTKLRKLES